MRKAKLSVGATILLLIVVLYLGCSSQEKGKSETTGSLGASEKLLVDGNGLLSWDRDVPTLVLESAKTQVENLFHIDRLDHPDYNYTDWRIESLTHSHTYPDFDGARLLLYRVNYEFFSATPDNILLAGGMRITADNWVVPGYPDSTYLIFCQDGDELAFIRLMVENDCAPGTLLLEEDLRQILAEKNALK